MTLTEIIFGQITLRTFSNIWYWLVVLGVWAGATHWIMGVPADMILSARRHGGQAAQDLALLADIKVRRLLALSGGPVLVLTGLAFFALTMAAVLGFYFGLELAQGVFCLLLPLVGVAVLTLRCLRRLLAERPQDQALAIALLRLRWQIQALALAAIFLTAVLGMSANLQRMILL